METVEEAVIMAEKNSTCCLILENSEWFAAITDLNMRGRIPSCPYQNKHKVEEISEF